MAAAMTDARLTARSRLALTTTAVVSVAAAAAVSWAAATPVGSTRSSSSAPDQSRVGEQEVADARSSLQAARAELAQLLASEDELPRAALPNLPTNVPSVQVPAVHVPAASAAVVQQAPPTHTTTGASGAVRP
jgi:hypothetical protein